MSGWRRRVLVGVVGLASAAMIAAGGVAAAGPAIWRPVAVPQPQSRTSHELDSVSCPTAGFCMAVGVSLDASDSGAVPVAETFNGRAWTRRYPTTVGPTTLLDGVSCVNAISCTAVGVSPVTGGKGHPVAEHWDGKTWRVEATAAPVHGGMFQSVSCPSASTCLATGLAYTAAGGGQGLASLAERWRSGGAGWTITDTPEPTGGSLLDAVSCPSTSRCVAAGSAGFTTTTKLHDLIDVWDGTHWTQSNAASPKNLAGLTGVSCATTASCVATGDTQRSDAAKPDPSSLVYAGSTWTVRAVPRPAGSTRPSSLDGVTCLSADSCTAVGFATFGSADTEAAVVEHWDGHAWASRTVSGSKTGISSLAGVSCASASRCFAVGSTAGTNDGLDVLVDQGSAS
jgi:hypothetical protein